MENENYALESNADVQRRTRAAERIFHTDNLSTHIERSSLLKCSNFETFTEIIPSFFKGFIGVAATFKERLVSTYKEEEGIDFSNQAERRWIVALGYIGCFQEICNRVFRRRLYK